MTEKYEGWANVETWSVALTIDNDRKLLTRIVAAAVVALKMSRSREEFAGDLADDVWAVSGHDGPFVSCEMRSALARAALARADWCQLAEHYMTKAREGVS